MKDRLKTNDDDFKDIFFEKITWIYRTKVFERLRLVTFGSESGESMVEDCGETKKTTPEWPQLHRPKLLQHHTKISLTTDSFGV